MVIIKIGNSEATIEDFKWKSKDKELQILLNSFLDEDESSPSLPFPDLDIATKMLEVLDGTLIEMTGRPEYNEERIY